MGTGTIWKAAQKCAARGNLWHHWKCSKAETIYGTKLLKLVFQPQANHRQDDAPDRVQSRQAAAVAGA